MQNKSLNCHLIIGENITTSSAVTGTQVIRIEGDDAKVCTQLFILVDCVYMRININIYNKIIYKFHVVTQCYLYFFP